MNKNKHIPSQSELLKEKRECIVSIGGCGWIGQVKEENITFTPKEKHEFKNQNGVKHVDYDCPECGKHWTDSYVLQL